MSIVSWLCWNTLPDYESTRRGYGRPGIFCKSSQSIYYLLRQTRSFTLMWCWWHCPLYQERFNRYVYMRTKWWNSIIRSIWLVNRFIRRYIVETAHTETADSSEKVFKAPQSTFTRHFQTIPHNTLAKRSGDQCTTGTILHEPKTSIP